MRCREEGKSRSLRLKDSLDNLHDHPCGIVENEDEEEVYRVTC